MLYKIGFLLYDIKENVIELSAANFLKKCKMECSRLIVGVFSDDFLAKMSMSDKRDEFENKYKQLVALDEVDEVIQINESNASLVDLWMELNFDLYFNGGIYGRGRQKDIQFLEDKGVEVRPVYEGAKCTVEPIKVALRQRIYNKKIILFGTGMYFDKYMSSLGADWPPAYAIDNDDTKWGMSKAGVIINSPSDMFVNETPDDTLVIICSKNYKDMEQQLLKHWSAADYRVMLYHPVIGLLEEYLYVYQTEQIYLEAIHKDLLKVLKEFDRICRENHLKYYVTGGSLIGVVRHRDFIPWDDDIDVTMPLSDFKKLKHIVKNIWNGDEFLLVDFDEVGEEKFYDFIPRLLYMKAEYPTGTYDNAFGNNNSEILHRAALDIFILNSASDSKVKAFIMENGIRLVYALCMGHRDVLDYDDYKYWSHFKVQILKLLNKVGAKIPIHKLFSFYRWFGTMAEKENSASFFEPNLNILYLSTRVRKEFYGLGRDMMLRDMAVRVPDNVKEQLNAKGYKEYMVFPAPKYQRPTHCISQKTIGW